MNSATSFRTAELLTRRAGKVGFFTLLSRIFGLFRDMAIAYAFGTHLAADAFFVAFRIPNLFRRLFAEGALTLSFVPIFTEHLKKGDQESRELANASWTLLTLVLFFVSLAGILFAPILVRFLAWGFQDEPGKVALTVQLTRIVFPYLLLVSLAAWAMGVLNSLKQFSVPAASPIFMNLGIIGGALVFAHFFDPPILGLAAGVLLGGLLQLGVHFPSLRKLGLLPRFRWNPSHPGVKKILWLMLPSAFGAAVYQFNVIVITLLASFLSPGAVSYLWYADRLMEFPLGIWGIALATVLLPSFSDQVVEGDMTSLKETLRYGLRMVLFVTVPAMVGLIVMGGPIIKLLFEHGSFGPASTLETVRALVFFAVGLPFISAVRVTSNLFFALKDSRTPVIAACLSVVANLILSLLLMIPLGHAGLALAVSLAALVNLIFQILWLERKVGGLGLRGLWPTVIRTALLGSVMGGAVFLLTRYLLMGDRLSTLSYGLVVIFVVLAGTLIYGLLEWLFKSPELALTLKLFKRGR